MKRQINQKGLFSLKSLKMNLLFILLPALLWTTANSARSILIQTRCSSSPQSCTKESIFPFDRLSVGMEDSKADEYSYFTQNLSGVLAVAVPVLWNGSLFVLGQARAAAVLASLGQELIVIFQAITWNGLFTESSHFVIQRARPFVYIDPAQRGFDPAHYTSFYSGHTSFTTVTSLTVFLILLARGAPWIVLFLSGALAEALVISTAYFRILAGRHFLTDVICAVIAATLTSVLIIYFHRNRGLLKKSIH
jgi:membrane-associated phospholipid phosphatase